MSLFPMTSPLEAGVYEEACMGVPEGGFPQLAGDSASRFGRQHKLQLVVELR